MPVGYTLAPERGLVVIRGWGVLTEADLSALVDALRNDTTIRPEWSTLSDMRGVERFAIGAAFMRGFRSAFSASARRAVIVGDRESQALVQMWLFGGRQLPSVGVFDTEAATFEWLGLPAATELPEYPATTFGVGLHV